MGVFACPLPRSRFLSGGCPAGVTISFQRHNRRRRVRNMPMFAWVSCHHHTLSYCALLAPFVVKRNYPFATSCIRWKQFGSPFFVFSLLFSCGMTQHCSARAGARSPELGPSQFHAPVNQSQLYGHARRPDARHGCCPFMMVIVYNYVSWLPYQMTVLHLFCHF